ncbi:MAG: hypothetical protein EA352_12165 [Gemmatimonadales bacterium]|nr:MAG: hypothetical protein EA352_12165 [Gemmatimonadales bacterium]
MPALDADRIVALLVLQFLVAAILWLASPRSGSVPLPRRVRLPIRLPGGGADGAGMDVRLLWLPGLMLPAGLLFFSAALAPVWRPLIPVSAFPGLPTSLAAGLALASWGLQAQLGRLALAASRPSPSPPGHPVPSTPGAPNSRSTDLRPGPGTLPARPGGLASRTPLDGPALLLPLAGALWLGGWIGLAVGGAMALWALVLAWLLQAPPPEPLDVPGAGGADRSHGAHGGQGAGRAANRVPLLATGVVVFLLVLTPLGAQPLLMP